MGVFDKFLNIMKLDDEDEYDEFDEYDDDDDDYEDEQPKRSFFTSINFCCNHVLQKYLYQRESSLHLLQWQLHNHLSYPLTAHS